MSQHENKLSKALADSEEIHVEMMSENQALKEKLNKYANEVIPLEKEKSLIKGIALSCMVAGLLFLISKD